MPVPADLPRGPWEATLVLRSGRVVRKLVGTVTFGGPVRLVEEAGGSPWPLVGGALGTAIVAAGVALAVRRRRRRATTRGRGYGF